MPAAYRWDNFEYILPPSTPTSTATLRLTAAASGLEFTGSANFRTVDSNGDDIAYDYPVFGEVPGFVTGVSEAAVDSDGDGKLDGIRATVDLNIRVAGNFLVMGDLSKDGQSLTRADSELTLAPGQRRVSLMFPGLPLKRSGVDGPYQGLVSLYSTDGSSNTNIGAQAFSTRAYKTDDFAVVFDVGGSTVAQGIDSNGNGLYDRLEVSFDAVFSRSGTFLLDASLRNLTGNHSVSSEQLLTVVPGTRLVTLEFAGTDLYRQQIDGPYLITVSLRDPATQAVIDRVTLPQETQSYRYTDFDPTRTAVRRRSVRSRALERRRRHSRRFGRGLIAVPGYFRKQCPARNTGFSGDGNRDCGGGSRGGRFELFLYRRFDFRGSEPGQLPAHGGRLGYNRDRQRGSCAFRNHADRFGAGHPRCHGEIAAQILTSFFRRIPSGPG